MDGAIENVESLHVSASSVEERRRLHVGFSFMYHFGNKAVAVVNLEDRLTPIACTSSILYTN